MIEVQIINHILNTKDIDLLNKLKLDYFKIDSTVNFYDEFKFIKKHYIEYKKVPDLTTFLSNFKEFEIFSIDESPDYLYQELLKKKHTYELYPAFVQAIEKFEEGELREAVNVLFSKDNDLKKKYSSTDPYYDFIGKADARWEDYIKREENKGVLGISTGREELDKILTGWTEQDFILLFAYSGHGKTTWATYFALSAFLQNKKILFFSLEIPEMLVGYKLDTLYGNFPNLDLLRGEIVGKEDYREYLDTLKEKEVEDWIRILTAKHNGGYKYSPSDIESKIVEFDPDLVIVDQLSLVDDEVGFGKDKRLLYDYNAERLNNITKNKSVPLILLGQANRAFLQGNSKRDKNPGAEHFKESNSPLEFSDKAISILKMDSDLFRLKIIKNRYGLEDVDFTYILNVNNGQLTYLDKDEETPY